MALGSFQEQELACQGAAGWRPRPESNRGARICSPLRNHSATRPRAPGVSLCSIRLPAFLRQAVWRLLQVLSYPAPLPPDDETPAPAPDRGEFIGKDEQAERNHPESEDRQEAEDTEYDQHRPNRDSGGSRSGHFELAPENADLVRPFVAFVASCGHAEFFTRLPVRSVAGNDAGFSGGRRYIR